MVQGLFSVECITNYMPPCLLTMGAAPLEPEVGTARSGPSSLSSNVSTRSSGGGEALIDKDRTRQIRWLVHALAASRR